MHLPKYHDSMITASTSLFGRTDIVNKKGHSLETLCRYHR